GRMRRNIAGRPKEGGVSEREQPAEPEEQVQRRGKEREAQHFHQEHGIENERCDQQQGKQDREDHHVMARRADRHLRGLGYTGTGNGLRVHQAVLPKSPAGLMSSTIAMMTKITTAEPSG